MPNPVVSASPSGVRRTPRRPRVASHERRVARLAQLDPSIGAAGHSLAARPLATPPLAIRARSARPRSARRWGTALPSALGLRAGRSALVVASVVPALSASVVQRPDAAAVCAAAALAIVIGVLRWSPSADGDERRPVAATALVLVGAVAVELFLLASGHPEWAPALVGPIASATIVTSYLATFGFRSTFLLRRVSLASLLLWLPLASIVERVVRSSIDPLSDLIHRRLAAVDAVGVSEHPWRVFTAMTDRGAVLVICAVMIATAMSRRRLTARGVLELAAAITLGLLVHHAALLTSPIEQYERSVRVAFVTGPMFELVLGGAAALGAAWIGERSAAKHGRSQNPSVTAAPDRDPVLFAVRTDDDAPPTVRIIAAVVPLALLLVLVLRTVTA